MPITQYRYTFANHVDLDDVECSLLLSIWSCESLHGEAAVRLELKQTLDRFQRTLVIDASTAVGKDLNRILFGFLQREFEHGEFTVERISPTSELAAA